MWTLANPLALLGLLVPFLLSLFFWFKKRKSKKPMLALTLLPTMLPAIKRSRRAFRALFLFSLLFYSLLILALARPIKVESITKRVSEGIDIVLALDVSESMEADDLKPTRILAAKSVIHDFVQGRPDDRIGLIIFGGEAMTKCPITRDHDFLLSQVEDVRLRELKQGTAIGMGIANAVARLRQSESKTKIVVLLTDGDSNVGAINPITATHLAKQEGIRIYTIGIGKDTRVVVPIYAYDLQGHRTQLLAQVPSYLNPELLQQISTLTGGKSYMAKDTGMLRRILQEIDELEKTRVQMRPSQKKEEFYLWPATLSLLGVIIVDILMKTRFKRTRVANVAA